MLVPGGTSDFTDLPASLSIDPNTGEITGSNPNSGQYYVTFGQTTLTELH